MLLLVNSWSDIRFLIKTLILAVASFSKWLLRYFSNNLYISIVQIFLIIKTSWSYSFSYCNSSWAEKFFCLMIINDSFKILFKISSNRLNKICTILIKRKINKFCSTTSRFWKISILINKDIYFTLRDFYIFR